jgi:hypothetical protein
LKSFYIILLSILTLSNAYSQKHFNNWYFGNKAGITFNTPTGEPDILLDGAMETGEGCSTFSDSSGNLMFYTDGRSVWNKNHQLMTNGTDLAGHTSSTQCGLIVPLPNSDSIFYIFTNDAIENGFSKGFNYSVVDISLENGLGAVTQKNIHVYNNKSEKLTAVSHKNESDIWIVTQDIDKNVFTVFLLNDEGLDTKRIESPAYFSKQKSQAGVLKFSPLGNKLVLAQYNVESVKLYDFDNENGLISNEMDFNISSTGSFETYGAEFSENGKMLYVSSNSMLHQYDISSNNQSQIEKSEIIIFKANIGQQLWALERGPDNKIYIANRGLILSVINQPNLPGKKCDFKYYAIDLKGRSSAYGLPNAIKTYNFVKKNIENITVCEGDTVFLSTANFADAYYEWAGPEGFISTLQNPVLISTNITMSGNYNFIVRNSGKIISQGTVIVTIHPRQKILFSGVEEIVVCEKFYDLQAIENHNGCSISWAGIHSTENTLHVTKSGAYTVFVENEFGCIDSATIEIKLKDSPDLEIIGDYVFCKGETIEISANYDYSKFVWSTGDTTKSISVDSEGFYFLVCEDDNGCKDSTGIRISELGKNIMISKYNHNYGHIDAGNLSEFTFTIFNNETKDITIQNLFIKNNPNHFELSHPALPITMKPKERIDITINFFPKYDIVIFDSLVIQINSPCEITNYISLKAVSEGQIIVDFWMPDTTAEVGTANYLMPMYVQLKNVSNTEFMTNIKAKITFLRTLFHVNNITTGQFSSEKLKDSISFNIELQDVIISDKLNILSNFEGLVLFNEIGYTDFIIEQLEFDNPYLIINAKNGSLTINELCNSELKGITFREGSFIGINNERNQIGQAVAYCGQAGGYEFSVVSSAGELLFTSNWITFSKSEKYFELSEVISSSGLYLLVLKSPDGFDIQKITFIK